MDQTSKSETVASAILALLKNYGVDVIFGIPGVHNLPFWNAESPELPRIINVRHEQTTVYAADGLFRSTGKIGVALTTTGPGAANTLGAFGEASISGSSVLVISSEAPLKNRTPGHYRGYLHEMEDQAALFAPLAKRSNSGKVLASSARSASEALSLISSALEMISSAPRGCAYVGIPADILSEPATEYETTAVSESFDLKDLTRVCELIENSTKISVWVGGGSIPFSDEISKFAEHVSAVVISSFAGRGVAANSPGYLQIPIHENEASEVLAESDLLLIIGSQFDGMNTKNWTLKLPEKIVVFDANTELHKRNIPVEIAVNSALSSDIFTALMRVPSKGTWKDVQSINVKARERIARSIEGNKGMELVQVIDDAWPIDGQIVCDMCIAGYWYGGYGTAKQPRRIAYPVGWGTLGFALPASVGVATQNKPTLVISGDGGIAFALSELATIIQEKLPVTILLHDDGGYGMLRYDQKVMNHPERGVDLINPRWDLLAESFGINFSRQTLQTLKGALTSASKNMGPNLILIEEELSPPRTTSPRWREK